MERSRSAGRTVRVSIVITILLFAASAARATEGRELSWRVGGGLAYPIAPDFFKNVHSVGVDVQGALGARVPLGFDLLATYEFTRFFVDENEVTDYIKSLDPDYDPGDPVDSNPTILHTVMAQAVVPFTLSQEIWPFLVGGVGWMWVRGGDVSYPDGKLGGKNESAFALTLGAGVAFYVSPSLTASVRLAWVVGFTDESTQLVPVLVEISH